MKYLLLALTLTLFSCGKDTTEVRIEEKEVIKEVFVAQDFEGYWYCDNNSNVELLADYQDRITFDTAGQSLNSINPANSTLGTFPTVGERDLVVNGNKLVINPRNYNFDSSKHDIEKDAGGDINGKKRVDLEVELINQSELKIKFTVYANSINSNINFIDVEREFNCSL